MTITLSSTTGVPADGWEAVVSQFLPGNMVFKSVSATAASTETVAAGDKNVQMLIVDVLTDNQSNPLSVTNFNLTSSDVKNIEKVSVYSLGDNTEFKTSAPFGEATVESGNIAVNGNLNLIEGHNYFGVVAYKPKGRFFWFVVVSVYRIILYSHLLPSHKSTNNCMRKAQRPKEPSLWLVVGGFLGIFWEIHKKVITLRY